MRSSSGRSLVAGFVVAGGLVSAMSAVMAASEEVADLSAAERELVELRQAYKDAQSAFWSKQRQYDSREEVLAAYESGELVDPDAEYLPKLLEYEAANRGKDVGVNALMHVFSQACRGGDRDGPRFVGAREAAGRLKHYAGSRLLPSAVGRASCYSLQSEPPVRLALRGLLEIPELLSESRSVMRFHLARADRQIHSYLPGKIEALAKLEAGEIEPQWPGAIASIRKDIARLPSIDVAESDAAAALETLRELAADEQSPRLAKVAAALLFKEERLVVDAVVPTLEVQLLDGSEWRMTDQRGKVVVIQFSFTGCGPCERMYPDLAELSEEHGDRLEILTLMRDETPEHAEAKVADGKLTWSIAIDGKRPGRIASKWSVNSFPEVYVIDQQGKITAIGLRGDSLREEVASLLQGRG